MTSSTPNHRMSLGLGQRNRARKVIIAVDLSDQAEQAFAWYIASVHRPDNEVVLLFANDAIEAGKKDASKVKELEDKYNGFIFENGISGQVKSEGGSKPGETICRVAEEEDAHMIVIGTRGLGKVKRTIMGSVSDYVVHHAPCPVIVCRQ